MKKNNCVRYNLSGYTAVLPIKQNQALMEPVNADFIDTIPYMRFSQFPMEEILGTNTGAGFKLPAPFLCLNLAGGQTLRAKRQETMETQGMLEKQEGTSL